jgi:hypothetical protein
MKIGFCVSILAVTSALAAASAYGQSKQFQEGTIVNVEKQDVATPPVRSGADPVHQPLQSHYVLYNVSVQLNCDVYVGRYQSELDDLPSALSPHHSVHVQVKKREMYLNFPGDTVKMQIVHHQVSHEGACAQGAAVKQ